MPIPWIPVAKRVPEDRRWVLVWGHDTIAGFKRPPTCFGKSRFNASPRGGRFDMEQSNFLGFRTITHWVELEGPTPDQTTTES